MTRNYAGGSPGKEIYASDNRIHTLAHSELSKIRLIRMILVHCNMAQSVSHSLREMMNLDVLSSGKL